MKRYLALFVLLGLFAPMLMAGAWAPGLHRGYMKLGISDYEATDFFGDSNTVKSFEGNNYSLYLEHGITESSALYGRFLFQDISQETTAGVTTSNDGVGDFELGLKTQWTEGPWIFSTVIMAKLPWLYDEDDPLPLGNGQEDYEARVLWGKSLYPYGYLGIEAGYRYRSSDPADEFRYLIEYGASFNKNLYFITKLDGISSVGSSQNIANTNLSATPEFDLGKFELTLGWQFEGEGDDRHWGVEFTFNGDMFGDSTLDGGGFQIGLTRKY